MINPDDNNGDPMQDDPPIEWVCPVCLGRMEHAPDCYKNPEVEE